MGESGNGGCCGNDDSSGRTKKKGLSAWQIGWIGGGLAILLSAGVAYERGKEVVPPKAPAPVTYVLPSRDAVESTLREPLIKGGHVVQAGETYASMGHDLYGDAEAGKRLRSINEYMGNVSMISETFVTDPFIDVNGDGKRTYWDFARRPRNTVTVSYPVLAPGDSLFTPKYMSGFDGMSYEYSAPVSEQAVGGAYRRIKDRVTDSLGLGNVKFIMPFEEGQSRIRFSDEIIDETKTGSGLHMIL